MHAITAKRSATVHDVAHEARVDRVPNNAPGGSHDVMDSLAGVVARRDNLG